MVTFLGPTGHLVISWIPLTTIDENIITAAPPRTLCGMIEISAASFGNSPHAIRKIPPVAIQKRFTTLFMATRPTFWLKEVFGSTPNSAAKEEPRPSHITPPESSLSVASLPRPPSVIPEISPTVSTAVTINMIRIGTMARASNTHFTGISAGTANHFACATLSQFRTQAFVASTVAPVSSTYVNVVGSTSAMILTRIYPTIIPMRIEEKLVKPFVPCFSAIITIRTTKPTKRFSREP